MNKYILKSDDKEVIKAALQLFQDLGYKLGNCDRSGMVYAKDGNVECDRLEFWSYYSDQEGCQELTLPQLRDLVVQSTTKEQDLISRADAKLAWANEETVEYFYDQWVEITQEFDLGVFDRFDKFRLKPRTIKIELEIPAPFEPKLGDTAFFLSTSNSCGYTYTNDFKGYGFDSLSQFGAWRTEEEIKQVVAAWRGGIKA